VLLITADERPEGWLMWNVIEEQMRPRILRQWRIGTERLWPPREVGE
jgi:hypothetical protein